MLADRPCPCAIVAVAAAATVASVASLREDDPIEAERARLATRASKPFFAEYRDVDEIDEFIDRFDTTSTLGHSIEGRPIRAIEISRGGSIAIAIDGGHHAREWLSVMVPLCIADRLEHAEDERTRRILASVRFYVAPLLNPDGYAYTWTHDRYWRKNRRGGYGVDLNRNYGVAWGAPGSSADKDSPNYRGAAAFSEPETRALRTLFEREEIAAHVDFHAYSQVIVFPWSHTRTPPADQERFIAIADRMSAAMFATHGLRYAVRPGTELKRGAGGTAGDWSYGEHGALSFLVELRPASQQDGGFVIGPEHIGPACDEGVAAVLAVADQLLSL